MAGDASAPKKTSALAAAFDAVEKGSGKKGEVKATKPTGRRSGMAFNGNAKR